MLAADALQRLLPLTPFAAKETLVLVTLPTSPKRAVDLVGAVMRPRFWGVENAGE